MPDKKSIEAYKNIKAPAELKEKVLKMENTHPSGKRKTNIVRIFASIAAVLAIVFSVVILSEVTATEIDVNPIMERSIDSPPETFQDSSAVLSATLFFDIRMPTTVTVSCGTLYYSDSDEPCGRSASLTKDNALVLKADTSECSGTIALTVKHGLIKENYLLHHDSVSDQWDITKI